MPTSEMELRRRRYSDGIITTPDIVSNFFSEFGKKVSPKSILDPFAGIGNSLKLVLDSCGKNTKALAIEINERHFKELEKLSKDYAIDCIYGDFLKELQNNKTKFDLIIGDTPFGLRVTGELSNRYRGLTLGGAITLESIRLLNEGGYTVLTGTYNFYSEYDKIKEQIEKDGLYLAGVIKIPGGAYLPYTSLASNIFIFKKGKLDDNVFLGTLESDNAESLVNNFFEGKSNSTGKFFSRSKVKTLSWDTAKSQDYIDNLITKGKIKKIEGIKVLSKIDLDETNSVFITTFGAPKIKLSLNEKEQKGRYIQLVLPSGYDKEIFACYYNSKFGARLFSSVIANTLGSISFGKARELDYYYPISGGDKAKLVSTRIKQIKESLDLQSKLLDENIFGNLDSVYEEISKIELLTERDYLMRLFPTIIVRPYKEYVDLKNNEDYTKAFDTLVNLTIALFMLGISVMWGGLKTNKILFDDMKDTIIKSVKRFGALTLGDMINMYASFSKAIRTQISQDGGIDAIFDAFGITDKGIIDKMIDKDITTLGIHCGDIRNRKGGHKGATSKEDDKRNLELLESSVFELISKFEWLKNIKVFLYGGKLSRKGDVFEISGTIFNSLAPYNGKLLVNDVPNDNTLYFSFDELGKPIELPGLIRYGESTDNKNKVAYVYSRINSSDKSKLDYLSYESYEEEKAYSMSEVTDDLFRILLDNSQRV